MNLLSNAIKFTKKGGKIILKLKCNEYKDDNEFPFNSIKFSIRDTGLGIKEENISKLA